jgi:hypothetical protein
MQFSCFCYLVAVLTCAGSSARSRRPLAAILRLLHPWFGMAFTFFFGFT